MIPACRFGLGRTNGFGFDAVIPEADAPLYEAKWAGRNRVAVAWSSATA